MKEFSHIPVMLEECMQGLNLKRTAPTGRLIATDLDDDAISAAERRLSVFEGRFKIYKSDYKDFKKVLTKAEINSLDGAILDFGVSSFQLDTEERGFSYMKPNAPLDMRMNRRQSLTAEILINEYSQNEIAKILKEYGEEKFASTIAANIIKARTRNRITMCGELVDVIENSIPKKFQQNGPAARKSFQAIRIAVNGELKGLYECVTGLTRRLKKGGRIVILTFHSLEDRIVKQAFRYLETDCICDKNLPVCVCGKVQEVEVITKKPIIASVKEMTLNSRSKCAKLRIAEKII